MCKFITAFLTLAVLGCGGGGSDQPDLGKVKGVVKVDGSPKAGIRVTFQPEDGRQSAGTTNEAGEYTLQYTPSQAGAKVGKHLVTITTVEAAAEEDGCGGGGDEEIFLDPIHPKYNTAAASNPEMTVEVKPGDNTFNFNVEEDLSARKKSGKRKPSSCCGE